MFIKITSGIHKGRRIKVPETDLRPTSEKVRSAFFDTIFSMINFEEGAFLDLFSGSGAICFEALSRGFESAVCVEKNPRAVALLKESSKLISDNITIMQKDAFSVNKFDFKDISFKTIYIDPPYKYIDKIPQLIDKLIDSGIVGEVCVIGVESGNIIDWSKNGWSRKEKRFGGTFLTLLYNWE
jgi:16S rRNA (guanine966-N2)-methyltransferase